MPLKAALISMMICIWPGPAALAQERISPETFLARATGKTLTFTEHRTGRLVGVEQFLRPDLSVWAQADGRCSYGHIEVRGTLMCFIYEDFPDPNNCWMPFDKDGQLMVISSDSFEIQQVSEITETPVDCVGAPLS